MLQMMLCVLLLLVPSVLAQCTSESCGDYSIETQMRIVMERLDTLVQENQLLKVSQ